MRKPVTWGQRVRAETISKGRELTLDELLELARGYKMNAEEIAEQGRSFARAMRPTGDARLD